MNMERLEEQTVGEVMSQLKWVRSGGRWAPHWDKNEKSSCQARHKVAIIIPYRDRLHHLIILLSWLHPILRRQQLDYIIYVAEQVCLYIHVSLYKRRNISCSLES